MKTYKLIKLGCGQGSGATSETFIWDGSNFDQKDNGCYDVENYDYSDCIDSELAKAKEHAQEKYDSGEWVVDADCVYTWEESYDDEEEIEMKTIFQYQDSEIQVEGKKVKVCPAGSHNIEDERQIFDELKQNNLISADSIFIYN